MTVYLDRTPFDDSSDAYTISIEDDRLVDGILRGEKFNAGGVVVESECCSDTMSVEVARKVHAALGMYVENHDVREWCKAAGIIGTDLDTAIESWRRDPAGADGIRVQSVIEANRA